MSSDPIVQSTSADFADERQRARALSNRHLWLLLVAVVTAVLCAPFLHALYGSGGDEGILLNGAERMLRGERLYADFFEFLPPGGFILTEAWFSIVDISFLSARSLAILTIVGVACFTYVTCQKASKSAPLSATLALGWVVLSQGYLTQGSHHWFTTLFSMIALWASLAHVEQGERWRWLLPIAGAAAGMAAMVTPNSGALAMLAAAAPLLAMRPRAKLIVYALGCALAPVGLLIYLAEHHALSFAFDDVVQFTLARYASVNTVPFGYGIYTPLTYVFPTTVLMTALVCVRSWRLCLHDRLFWTCAAFCLAGFLGCFPRPDTSRISYIVPLALPLLAYCMVRLAQLWRRPMGWQHGCSVAAVAAIVIWVGTPPVYFFASMAREALRGQIMPTPRGSATLVLGLAGISKIVARIAATPSTDAYFFYPTPQMLSFLTAREQVSKYDALVPNYTLPSQYRDACISVMQHASWVVINRYSMDSTKLKFVFPAMRDIDPKERKQFEQALDDSFTLVAQEGVFELRQRRKGINESICARID